MKKEYVKPENRVVELKDKLLDIGGASDSDIFDAKVHIEEESDSESYSDDIWED